MWGDGNFISESAASPEEIQPDPRVVNLNRDKALGFGFVAGSEKPVIVR